MTMAMPSSTPLSQRPAPVSLDTLPMDPSPAAGPSAPLLVRLEIPAVLVPFAEQQARRGAFMNVADYALNLIRTHQEDLELREGLLEGLRSGPSRFADDEYFEALEAYLEAADKLLDTRKAGGT